MKAGTTTLCDYLQEVPEVFMPNRELYFFSDDEKYARGLDWYEDIFNAANGATAIGEKTVTYSYAPAVPERIKTCLPDVKLIWIFREPVARAYSNYWHSVRAGSERLSFEKAVARESARLEKDLFRGYFKRSRYAEQVERYLQHFSKEQMLFLLFEELVKDPVDVLNRLLRFVGVTRTLEVSLSAKHSHPTGAPRSIRLQWLARRLLGDGRAFGVVRRLNRRPAQGYPRINPQLLQRLKCEFREANTRLAALTGLNLTVWNS